MLVPKLIHFIFGFSKDSNNLAKFGLHHYLAIKSAFKSHPNYKLVVWVGMEPEDNLYWVASKKYVEVIKIDPPEHAFGIKLKHYAHKADFWRLQVLRDYGGIYQDLDTLTIKNFEGLNCTETVMAPEIIPVSNRVQGLCNATIVARQNSNFINRWLDTFQFFNSEGRDINWEFHSVKMPLILSRQYAWDIKIVPNEFFFKFKWCKEDYSDLFERVVDVSNCYSIHLWESHIADYLYALKLDDINNIDTTYNLIARTVIEKDF